MALEGGAIEIQRILDEIGGRQRLHDPRDSGVTLLHGDDLLDVRDVFREAFHLAQHLGLLGREPLRERVDKCRQLFALGVRSEETGQIVRVFLERVRDIREMRDPRFAQAVGNQHRGNVHAVEDVADVVQHAGGDFRHARLPRNLDQVGMHLGQFLLGQFALSDVLRRAEHPRHLAIRTDDHVAPLVGDALLPVRRVMRWTKLKGFLSASAFLRVDSQSERSSAGMNSSERS